MLYDIVKTEGFILSAQNLNNAKKFCLLTREYGLIFAFAYGLERSKSKNNSHLQDFSLIDFDLIFSQKIIISEAQVQENFLYSLPIKSQKILLSIFKLLIKILPEEQKVLPVYNDLLDLFQLMSLGKIENSRKIEVIFLARFLNFLGYLPIQNSIEIFEFRLQELNFSEISQKDIDYLIKEINSILKNTSF